MFWEKMTEMCRRRHCRPNTVAKAVGLSSATATKWKKGSMPNGDALIKIADYLDCSVDYLLGRAEYEERNKPPVPITEDERLSKEEREFMSLLERMSLEQKTLLLAMLKITIAKNQALLVSEEASNTKATP